MKRYIKNPFAKDLAKHGYKVQITDGDGVDAPVTEEYFVTPEEIAKRNERRIEHLAEYFKNNSVQN